MLHCIALGKIAMATENSEDMNHVGTTRGGGMGGGGALGDI